MNHHFWNSNHLTLYNGSCVNDDNKGTFTRTSLHLSILVEPDRSHLRTLCTCYVLKCFNRAIQMFLISVSPVAISSVYAVHGFYLHWWACAHVCLTTSTCLVFSCLDLLWNVHSTNKWTWMISCRDEAVLFALSSCFLLRKPSQGTGLRATILGNCEK